VVLPELVKPAPVAAEPPAPFPSSLTQVPDNSPAGTQATGEDLAFLREFLADTCKTVSGSGVFPVTLAAILKERIEGRSISVRDYGFCDELVKRAAKGIVNRPLADWLKGSNEGKQSWTVLSVLPGISLKNIITALLPEHPEIAVEELLISLHFRRNAASAGRRVFGEYVGALAGATLGGPIGMVVGADLVTSGLPKTDLECYFTITPSRGLSQLKVSSTPGAFGASILAMLVALERNACASYVSGLITALPNVVTEVPELQKLRDRLKAIGGQIDPDVVLKLLEQ